MTLAELAFLEAKRYGWLHARQVSRAPLREAASGHFELEEEVSNGQLYAPLRRILQEWPKDSSSLELQSALLHCVTYLGVPGSAKALSGRIAALGGNNLLALRSATLPFRDLIHSSRYAAYRPGCAEVDYEDIVEWLKCQTDDPQAAVMALSLVRLLAWMGDFDLAWTLWNGAVAERFVPGICWWSFCELKCAEDGGDFPYEVINSDHAILRNFIAGRFKELVITNPTLAEKWAAKQLECEPHSAVDRVLVRAGPKKLRWSFAKRHLEIMKLVPRISTIEVELNCEIW